MERHCWLPMLPPRAPTPPTLPMGLQGAQQEQRSATAVDMEPIPTDPERANQIAQTMECLARRQRKKLSGTPIHSHIKMIKFESNKTADLDDMQTEASVKKSGRGRRWDRYQGPPTAHVFPNQQQQTAHGSDQDEGP